MRLRTWYKVHKWVAITSAVAIVVWLASGLIMILPPSDFAREAARPPAVDYPSVAITPAEAVARFRRERGDSIDVRDLALVRIVDRLAYRIVPGHGKTHLVDAATGAEITITEQLAGAIARAATPDHPEIVRIETSAGPAGGKRATAYKVWFAGNRSLLVSAIDGAISMRRASGDRFRVFGGSLHTFAPLGTGPRSDFVRLGALWLFGVTGLFVAGTGVYLALPKRWKVRRQLRLTRDP